MSKRINVELQDDEYKLLKDTINGTISEYLETACVVGGDYRELAHELMIVYNKIFGKTFSIEPKKERTEYTDKERESIKNTLKEVISVQLSDEEYNNLLDEVLKVYSDEEYRKSHILRGLGH